MPSTPLVLLDFLSTAAIPVFLPKNIWDCLSPVSRSPALPALLPCWRCQGTQVPFLGGGGSIWHSPPSPLPAYAPCWLQLWPPSLPGTEILTEERGVWRWASSLRSLQGAWRKGAPQSPSQSPQFRAVLLPVSPESGLSLCLGALILFILPPSTAGEEQ